MIVSSRVAFSLAAIASAARGFSTGFSSNFSRVAARPSSPPRLSRTTFAKIIQQQRSIGRGRRLFATVARGGDIGATKDDESATDKVPITLLAGFLGSGKTTTLQNLLTNNDGLKIGIIVNDVASINIDNKLLSNPCVSQEETIELQNGCACCSLADELITSVEQLLMKDSGGNRRDFDAIVVELSGVADPVQVKDNWKQAVFLDHPATKLASMDKVVTLVDSSTFGTDWMTWDTPSDRDGWVDPETCGQEKNVPELLAEQIEAADVLIVNKVDLAGEAQVKVASELAKSLNDKAGLFETKFGEISFQEVLGAATKVQEERKKAEEEEEKCNEPGCTDESHSHEHHSHDHAHEAETCDHPSHSHDHDHSAEQCTDTSHSHDHAHEAETCDHPSHSHDHDHDGECTDESHSHSHSHSHQSTSADKLGIVNFVYKADRPFVPIRLLTILNSWPVPVKEELDFGLLAEAATDGYTVDGEDVEKSAFVGVLRSKGFCWMAPTKWIGANEDIWRHNTCMYWSHAGKHFGISTAGKWWGTIKREQMKMYFVHNEKEYERILREDFVTEEFGDRRQEIVFIGANINEEEIRASLDACLANDEEMVEYRRQLKDFEDSQYSRWVKPIKPVTPKN